MYDIIKDHMRTLLAQTETAKKAVEEIEKKYPFWLWQWYIAEAANIYEYLYKLESEVTLLGVDCIELMGCLYNDNRSNKIFEECYYIYMGLDRLVDDLKDVRANLEHPSVYYSDRKRLRYDWMRFSEIISEVYDELKSNELDKNYWLM